MMKTERDPANFQGQDAQDMLSNMDKDPHLYVYSIKSYILYYVSVHSNIENGVI